MNRKNFIKKRVKKRLYRSEEDRIIGGVAGGLAEFLHIDSTIIRLTFILFTFLSGTGIILYFVLWLVIPDEESLDLLNPEESFRENVEDIRKKFRLMATAFKRKRTKKNDWWGVGIIAAGLLFLLWNFGFFNLALVQRFWPGALILLGIALTLK